MQHRRDTGTVRGRGHGLGLLSDFSSIVRMHPNRPALRTAADESVAGLDAVANGYAKAAVHVAV
jgi:hypothetical protein